MIDRRGPITLSALAERLEADKGMLSRAVSELEGLGLVERTVDPTDGRIRLITVTADGHARLEAARVPYFDRLDDVLTDWPVDSVRQLSRLLEALTSGLAL
ncbi:MarR family winged helix-turn-helix transcriptional regulator [Microbacterium elymi]|uniref:MarR family transcriptional regulator n=1 Tax=Microbacterium elymi TaxID=2909587 RepID=A0ABY5NIF9_9MICO|nr:MarR family transcriptional regulator [Microbacterium elymi]UUT34911.1 MarR family transcriptional regulator [Microbacterium elymi]